MNPCTMIIIYVSFLLVMFVLAVLSIKLKWPELLIKIFVAATLLSMLSYPFMHQYSIECYRGPCVNDT